MFSSIQIGKHIALPNRFMMAPIYATMEADFKLESQDHMTHLAAFYAERARFGAKLIVCGGLAPSVLGRWKRQSISLTTLDTASKLRIVTDAVHKEDGKILAQAYHAGRSALRRVRLSSSTSGGQSFVHPFPNFKPIAIPSLLVNLIVREYERFAKLAEDAGFDGIELSLSDGSLLHNFLSPAVNDRIDAFGGSFENRIEIVLRVLANVKNSLIKPDNFTVTVRLCVHDLKPNGSTIDETKILAEILAGSGVVDLILTSVGMHDSPVQTLASYVPRATFSKSTKLIRDHLRSKGLLTPIAASHRLNTEEVINKVLHDGVCDLVALGRPLLADAQFISKLEEGRQNEIIPCIACNQCVNRLYKHQRVACAVNPRTGFERERWRNAPAAPFQKNVAVVGAGAAGITCALTLSQRGHSVILYEKSGTVGGQLNLAKVVPGKEEYFALLEYWTNRLRESTVKVKLNTEFTHYEVTRNHQLLHAIVLCHGSIPKPALSNNLPGASESKILVPFERILDGSVLAGRRVAIIGGGPIALDVASYLVHDQRVSRSIEAYCVEWGVNLETGTIDSHASKDCTKNNRDVVIFNKAERDADLSRGKGWSQKLWLRNHKATIINCALVEKVDHKGVYFSIISPDSRDLFAEVDTIVWAVGMLPNIKVGTWVYEWFKDGADKRGQIASDFGIYAAGTCRDAFTGEGHGEQDLLQVVHEAYEIGCKI